MTEQKGQKLGMVFEGGANRTVFSCGVMDVFLEEHIMPDYFIGVSAGIAFGVSYLSTTYMVTPRISFTLTIEPASKIFPSS